MGTLALGLIASLCWGVSDFLAGSQSRRLSVIVVLLVSQSVGLAIFAVVALISGEPVPPAVWILGPLAGIAGSIGLAALYRALAVGTMSIVAPIVATGTALPVTVGLLGGDRLGMLTATGVALAFAGIVLATRGGDGDRREARGRRMSTEATALSILGACAMGLVLVALHASAEHSIVWTVALARATSTLGWLAVFAIVRPAMPSSARGVLPLAAVGALEAAATALYAVAATQGLLSLAAVASSLYPVVTVLMAQAFLHERLDRRQAWGVGAALVGVVLMATR